MELIKLFSMLGNDEPVRAGNEDLFCFEDETHVPRKIEQDDLDFIACYCSDCFNLSALDETAKSFFELSVNAFDAFVHAWMSEMPIDAEIVGFGRRVIAAADACSGGMEEKRTAAEMAACDCGGNGTLTVINAAAKVRHEIHRMMGLLRFLPDTEGVYIARCAPDFMVLPGLGKYFTERFGDTEWAVIDEKRGLCLYRRGTERAKIVFQGEKSAEENGVSGGDEWENLWRHYHKTINNESRNNPALQRQFMPKRYWKYLPEV